MLNVPLVPVAIVIETWPAHPPRLLRQHLRGPALRVALLPGTRPLDHVLGVLRLIQRLVLHPFRNA